MTSQRHDTDTVRIGTRSSPLALEQAEEVAHALIGLSGGALSCETLTFKTQGDQLTTERLINSGGKGLFTREIDAAVSDGRADIGVHSLKDVPSDLPDGQELVAFLKREDPRDGFITRSSATHPRDLPGGAVIGTASLRRESQSLAMRPDFKVVTFRGSVQTRLRKLEEGLADATYLAMAGLNRLGLADHAVPVPPEDMIPAAGQGIIAVAARPGALSPALTDALAGLDHHETRLAAAVERAFLLELDGSCRTAMGGHAWLDSSGWHFIGEVLTPDGSQRWQERTDAPADASEDDLAALGRGAGRAIREAAGGDLPAFDE